MSKINLKDYICSVPFSNLELQVGSSYLCCPSWMTHKLPQNLSVKDAWTCDEANDIRNSILDGSYKYCDKTQCPFLKQFLEIGNRGNTNAIFHKSQLPIKLKSAVDNFKKGILNKPTNIVFSFDRSCNLKCPSCRFDLIIENSVGIQRVKKTIDEIEKEYGDSVKTLYITGSGDPFISVGFRDFLRNFDKSKWPILEKIHLHTNATKWNKNMWDSMSNIHPYVTSCEISIDAATKETYENKVRLNGNWDELIDNLKFIETIPTLVNIKTSFVVQTYNYKEMKLFYDLMISIFGKKVNIFYGKINNWGTFTNEEYLSHKIWDESHPLYNDFVNEINSFVLKDKVWHNLQEIVNPIKSLI